MKIGEILSSVVLWIFDWSGVISDDKKPVYETDMGIIEEYGNMRMSYEKWIGLAPKTLEELLLDFQIVFPSYEEREKIFRKYYERVLKLGIRPIVYPDVKDTLEYLSRLDKKIVVVSAHPIENLKREAEEYRIKQYFSFIYGSTTENKTEALISVCRDMKVNRRQAVLIGDSIYDVASAKEAGVLSLAVSTGYHSLDELMKARPKVVASSLTALMKFLRAWS